MKEDMVNCVGVPGIPKMARERLWRAAESVPGARVAGSCGRVPASVPLRVRQSPWPGCPLRGPGFVLHARTSCSGAGGSQGPLKLETGDIPSLASLPQATEEPKALRGWFTPPIPGFFSAELCARHLRFALQREASPRCHCTAEPGVSWWAVPPCPFSFGTLASNSPSRCQLAFRGHRRSPRGHAPTSAQDCKLLL